MRSAEQLGLMGDPQPMVALPRDYEPSGRPTSRSRASSSPKAASAPPSESGSSNASAISTRKRAWKNASTRHTTGWRWASETLSRLHQGREAYPCVRGASVGGAFRPGERKRLPELLALLSLRLLPYGCKYCYLAGTPRRQVLALGQDIREPARDAARKSTASRGGSEARPRSTWASSRTPSPWTL